MTVFMATSLVHAEEAEAKSDVGNIGVGYQGLFLDDLISGVAVRGKPAPFGWQVELLQGMLELDPGGPRPGWIC